MLINLLKNAHESGSSAEEVTVSVEAGHTMWQLKILDRGSGDVAITVGTPPKALQLTRHS